MVNQKTLQEAKKIMGKNFIGPEELKKLASRFPISLQIVSPPIPWPISFLKKIRKDYILILGVPKDKNGKKFSLVSMREFFGWDPLVSEPCFYNQDWYVKEKFAARTYLESGWHLVRKEVISSTRAKDPSAIAKSFKSGEQFPSAVLTAFTFFAYYLLNREMLWKHDFVWCSDLDHNGDRIYAGRYLDPNKINKNGFNVHRYLQIRSAYGLAPEIIL